MKIHVTTPSTAIAVVLEAIRQAGVADEVTIVVTEPIHIVDRILAGAAPLSEEESPSAVAEPAPARPMHVIPERPLVLMDYGIDDGLIEELEIFEDPNDEILGFFADPTGEVAERRRKADAQREMDIVKADPRQKDYRGVDCNGTILPPVGATVGDAIAFWQKQVEARKTLGIRPYPRLSAKAWYPVVGKMMTRGDDDVDICRAFGISIHAVQHVIKTARNHGYKRADRARVAA